MAVSTLSINLPFVTCGDIMTIHEIDDNKAVGSLESMIYVNTNVGGCI